MNENIVIKPEHTDPSVLSSKTSCFNFPKDQHAFFLLLLLTEIHTILLTYAGMAEPGGHLEFGISVNPIHTRGADYAPHTTANPPGFIKLSTPLVK